MVFNGISQPDAPGPSGPKPARQDRVRQETERGKHAEKPPGIEKQPDRTSISADAAEVARYRELAELHREAYGPPDRSHKLAEVRKRIESGHYDDPATVDRIAGKMVDETAATRAGSEEIDTVRRRTESGFYDRPDVVDRTAENMLRHVVGRRGPR
ncbi:MAG: hypothetical protein MAG453_01260 [Calditrichaeota bacterium]|nr:hypothetical protein [Calditrichota bacterium]